MSKLIYLACPYSHHDKNVVKKRFNTVTAICSILFRNNYLVFSSITHCHPMTKYGLPGGWEFWEEYDRKMIDVCDEVWVLMLDGWVESIGIEKEIEIAQDKNKTLLFVSIENILNMENNNEYE